MIISCPDCNGKLSTVAPTCPHCGYVQSPPPPAASPTAPSDPAAPEFAPPSRSLLQEAAKKQWMRWEQDNFWSLAFGALAVLGVIGLIALLISYLSRMGVGR